MSSLRFKGWVPLCALMLACWTAYFCGTARAAELTATRFDVLARTTPCAGPLPASVHPYPSFLTLSWTNTCPDAEALEITFDAQTHFEDGFDVLHIIDNAGEEVAGSPFTGDRLAGKTLFVRGNTLLLRLETDSAVSDWGFKVSSIFALYRDQNPSAVARHPLTLLWEVQNQAVNTVNAPWFGSVYLSTSPTWSPSAIRMGRDSVEVPLLPNASYSQISVLSAPNVIAGDYYLLFRAEDGDAGHAVEESTNELAIPLRIENVDLAAISLKAPASAAPQEQISVTWTATNRSTWAALPDWCDYVSISQGPNSNSVDWVWQNAAVPGGATYSVKRTVTIPSLAAGTYNLEIQVNALDLAETNLANNTMSLPISIAAADLVGLNAVIDGAVAAGEWFSAAFTVSNASPATAYGPWHDIVYLSRTNRWTPEAVQVGEAAQYDVVSPHTTYIQYFDLNLSAEYTGDWFLVFEADGGTNLGDANMDDNTAAVPLRIKAADLAPTSFRATIGGSTHLVASPQQSMNISWRVKNEGAAKAERGWPDTILLATDPAGTNPVAVVAVVWQFSGLDPLEDYGRSTTARAPPVPPGDYFLLLHTDRENYQPESNDSNNTLSASLRIVDADLGVQALTAPASAAPEQPFDVSWTIRNFGPGTAYPPWEDVLYLASTNDLSAPLQALLRQSSSSSLAAGAAYSITQSVHLSSLPAGNYALVLERHYLLYPSEIDLNDRASTPIRLQGPDLAALAVRAPSVSCLQSNIEVTVLISNAGPSRINGPSEVQFFLSTASTWSPDAVPLGASTTSVLIEPGGVASVRGQVFLSGHAPGAYFLIARVDPIRYADPDAFNNFAHTPLTISVPDLVPQSLVILEASTNCQDFFAESPHPYPATFVFATTQVCPEAEAIRIRFDSRTDVGPDTIEITDGAGTPVEGSPFTGNELANTTVKIIGDTVRIRFAATHNYSGWGFAVTDARGLGASTNTVVAAQQLLDFRWDIRNEGTAPSLRQPADTLALLSEGPRPNSQVITSIRGTELAAGNSYRQHATASLPSVKPGRHTVVLYADSQSDVEESSETNNVFSRPIVVTTPEIAVTDLQSPSVLDGQSSFTVVWRVRNTGAVDAFPSWIDRLYISVTNKLTPQALEISSYSHYSSLQPGNSYSVTQFLTLPPLPSSNYFLIAKADADARLFDSSTDDNDLARPISIRNPDLVATNFEILATGPYIFAPHAEVELSYRVQNLGPGNVLAPWWDQIFFSGDRVADEDDIPLITDLYGSNTLAVAATYERRARIRLPEEDAGNYFLVLKANAYGSVAERSDSNNTLAIPIRLAPVDLEVTSAETTNQGAPHESIVVSWSVRNRGTASALPPWADTVYFSKTPVLGNDATPLGSVNRTETIPAGGSYLAGMSVRVPNAAAGTYYLIVSADSQNRLSDANTTNNFVAVPITIILPDLRVAAFGGDSTNLFASPQTGVSLHWRVQNVGPGLAVAPWLDGFYLSPDTELDGNDTFLGTVAAPYDLAAGAEYVQESVVNVGAVPPGPYYLFLKLDAGNNRPETTETNNAAWVRLTVGDAADLRPAYLNAPTSLEMTNRSTMIDVAWGVTNQGAAATPVGWSDNIYLSRDARYDPNDLELTSKPHRDSLSPGGSYAVLETVTLQVDQSGLYYLLLWVDGPGSCPQGCLYEMNETNNLIAVPLQVTLKLPDLVVTEVRAPPLLVSSADYVASELTWVVRNQGPGAAVGSWTDGVYVNGQYHQSTFRDMPLPPGASYTNGVRDYLSFPSNGTYTVTVQADDSQPFNDILETAETNNSRSASFQFVRSPKELLLPGENGSVPLFLATPSPAARIDLDLFAPTGKVANLSASDTAPQISSVTTLATDAGWYHLRFETLPNEVLVGTQQISRIHFQVVTNQSSAFVPFSISNLTARSAQGGAIVGAFARPGRGVIIGPEPLLEAIPVASGQHALTLYGLPTSNVVLQSKAALAIQPWTNTWQGSFTNRFQSLGPYPTPNNTRFYRALY